MPTVWTTQTAQLVLGYPMARGSPTSAAIYSPKDRLGDEVCRSPRKWQEAIGQGGEGTAGFQMGTALWPHGFLAP